jgi:hypothetical protein
MTLSFYQFYSNLNLLENKKEGVLFVKQGKISQQELDDILNIDPTPSKKFTGWMAKQWFLKNVKDLDTLRNTIEEFNVFLERGKTKERDIYKYSNFKELQDDVDYLNKTSQNISIKDLEEDYEVVRDDQDLLVCVPHTHEASRKLGLKKFSFRDCGNGNKDSAWCTTYKTPNHFNDYYFKQNVTFYYVRVNSDDIKNNLNKQGYNESYFIVAVVVMPEEMEAYNGLDQKFSGSKLQKYLDIIGLS